MVVIQLLNLLDQELTYLKMAHFAKINSDNIVTEVIVINNDVIKDSSGNEQEFLGVTFCMEIFGDGTYLSLIHI